MCSSCTEWRRSDFLLLSLQQEAGGATREVTEEASGSKGSNVGLTDALDKEEGGEELGGWGRNTMLLLLEGKTWVGTWRWESDWLTKGGRWSRGGITVTEGRVFLRRWEWGDWQAGSWTRFGVILSNVEPPGVKHFLGIRPLEVAWDKFISVRERSDRETLGNKSS